VTTSARSAGDWIRLGGIVAMYGTAFLFISLAVETVPPASLVAARLSIAAVLLAMTSRLLGVGLPPPSRLWLRFLLLACVGNAIPFFLISWGQQRVPSGLSGILMAVMPLATLVLAHFFVADERLTRRRAAGFAVGFAGVVVLTGPEALTRLAGERSDLVHQLAILLGAVCYGINTILARRMPATHPLVAGTGTLIMGSCVMLPVAAILDRPWQLEPSGLSLLAVGWLGVVPTAAATVLYFRIVSSAGPTFLSLMNYAVPAVALLTGIAVLREPFEWRIVVAGALILAGLFTSQGRRPATDARAL